MLPDVKEEMIKSILLRIPLSSLTENIINGLKKFTGSNSGKTMLRFYIHDPEERINIEMFSRNQKVRVTDDLLNYLTDHPDIEFKLN